MVATARAPFWTLPAISRLALSEVPARLRRSRAPPEDVPMKRYRALIVLCALVLLLPSTARSVGNLTIPNTIAAQSGPNLAASLLDQNWSTIASYVNARELTIGTLGARPAASTSGRLYVA